MKIIPLSEGSFTIDSSKLFVPFNVQADNLQERPTGSLLVEVQPFLVISSEDILLIDTGLGFEDENGQMQIHKNLAEHGIQPGDITKVLMSHLHKDHAGGISRRDRATGKQVLAFPNAKYFIQKKELEFAFEKGLPSYIPEELECLKESPQVILLPDQGVIEGYIKYEMTGAHSPFHQVFWIVDGDQRVFFGADDAPQLQQMKSRFVAKYDYDGRKCMELRHKWWQQGEAEHWTFLFYHDINSPMITL
ncbi:MAG: MBL fold metallo-hydrolase [Chitinophagaceae bacterium]|nr:MAG: MBL fold metallo-hydrolase [Chitinophagaceae bacterium]